MRLVALGINHKTAPVSLREALAVPRDEIRALLEALVASPQESGVAEAMLLSTCNRVEIYAVPAEGAHDRDALKIALVHALTSWRGDDRGVEVGTFERHGYVYMDEAAVLHLLRVTASLDSMVVGEPQILGQVKEAAAIAKGAGAIGTTLSRLLDRAFSAAKAVRTDTTIAHGTVSIGSVAVDLAKRIFEKLVEIDLLLVGAGEMAEATAHSLTSAGIERVYVANRSLDHARRLAERHGWRPRALTELEDLLARADVVIASTGASRPIIDLAMMRRVLLARKYRPIFLVDIAVPRNIAQEVSELDTVYLYNIDDLEQISHSNMAGRQRDVAEAEAILRKELSEIDTWYRRLEVKPTVVAIRKRANEIAHAELDRTLGKRLTHLGDEERRALAKMVDATVNKLLHPTMVALHAEADGAGRDNLIAAAHVLYGLDADDAPLTHAGREHAGREHAGREHAGREHAGREHASEEDAP